MAKSQKAYRVTIEGRAAESLVRAALRGSKKKHIRRAIKRLRKNQAKWGALIHIAVDEDIIGAGMVLSVSMEDLTSDGAEDGFKASKEAGERLAKESNQRFDTALQEILESKGWNKQVVSVDPLNWIAVYREGEADLPGSIPVALFPNEAEAVNYIGAASEDNPLEYVPRIIAIAPLPPPENETDEEGELFRDPPTIPGKDYTGDVLALIDTAIENKEFNGFKVSKKSSVGDFIDRVAHASLRAQIQSALAALQQGPEGDRYSRSLNLGAFAEALRMFNHGQSTKRPDPQEGPQLAASGSPNGSSVI